MDSKTRKTLGYIIVCAIMVASLWISLEINSFLGFGIMIALSLYMILPIKNYLMSIAKNFFVIKFFNVVIWFLSYIISIKLISYSMDVSEDYLKFSPAIVAIPVSLILVFIIVFIICMLGMALTSLYQQPSFLLPIKLQERIENSRGMFFLERLPFLLILLILPFSIVGAATPFILKLSILTDASFVSDCGVKSSKIVYLRKNDKECYLIELSKFTINGKLPVIPKSKG